jgi:predicted transcriptional regulator
MSREPTAQAILATAILRDIEYLRSQAVTDPPHRSSRNSDAGETRNSIHVSDELLAELQAKAAAEGKTVDELAEEALRKSIQDRKWQELLAYGLERGRASGYTVEDVPSVVRENRRRHREQRVRDIENALASGRIEGLEPSSEALAIFQRYIDGELTLEQMGAAIDEHADREYGPVRLPRNQRS